MLLEKPEERRWKPWKNGGGETSDIAVFPDEAGFDDFVWRLSMARVAQPGPFSAFPGVDRSLAILDGAGVALFVGDDPPVTVTKASAPRRFPADVPTRASLIAGAVTDLNLMTRRGRVDHVLHRIVFDGPGAKRFDVACGVLLWVEGVAEIAVGPRIVRPAPLEAVGLDGGGRCAVTAEGPALAYLSEIGVSAR